MNSLLKSILDVIRKQFHWFLWALPPQLPFGSCAIFEFDQGYRNSLIKAMAYSCILLPCLWCRAKYKQLQHVVEWCFIYIYTVYSLFRSRFFDCGYFFFWKHIFNLKKRKMHSVWIKVMCLSNHGSFWSVIFPVSSAAKRIKPCKLKAISGVAILRDAGTSTPTSSAGATKGSRG